MVYIQASLKLAAEKGSPGDAGDLFTQRYTLNSTAQAMPTLTAVARMSARSSARPLRCVPLLTSCGLLRTSDERARMLEAQRRTRAAMDSQRARAAKQVPFPHVALG